MAVSFLLSGRQLSRSTVGSMVEQCSQELCGRDALPVGFFMGHLKVRDEQQ